MFQLTTGSYPTLESAFLRDITTQKKEDLFASVLVLSPSGQILNRLQAKLAESHAYLNIHFLTFYALAERILAEGPAPEGRIVSEPALYRELIHDYLSGRSEIPFISKDDLLRSRDIPRGLTGALAATLKDLQDSGARVVDCANAVREGHLDQAAESAIPILELNVLMYKSLHDRGLRTSADRIRRASERIPQSAWIQQQKAIYLYGFYDLTGVQLDLVNALAARPNAHVYFPYEEGNPAFAYAELLLKDPAFASKTELRSTRKAADQNRGRPEPQREVLSIKEHHSLPLGSTDSQVNRPSGQPSLEAYSCSGTHDEVWLSAKKILELADKGVPFHEMSVQARTLEPYQHTIREVFAAHKIPFALHAEEPVGAYPLIKKARAVLNEARVETTDTWSNHVEWSIALLANEIRLPKDSTTTEIALWEGLTEAMLGLSELDALGKPVTWDRFLEVTNEKLESLKLPLWPTQVPGVQVMDVMTARGLSFRAVFLLGLNEKLFPRLIREDPFLSDEARSKLSQALGCRLGRKMDGFQEEKLLFHLATSQAVESSSFPAVVGGESTIHRMMDPPPVAVGDDDKRSYLHLSCQRSDEEGKALVISLYLNDFLKKAGLKLEPLPRALPERMRKAAPTTLTPKEVSIAFHREGQEPSALYTALGWDQALLGHLLDAQKEIEEFGSLGSHDGLIGKGHPLSKTLLEKGLSPQSLKDLAECPFKVFGRKVLELYTDQPDVEDGQLTHTGRGKLIHKILQLFYQSASQIKSLDTIASKEFGLFADEFPDLYPLVWQAETTKMMAMLKRFVPLDLADQAATGFKPTYFETPMAGEMAGVKIQGRIDRLDIGPTGFRVVDYKTGSGGIKKGESVETAIMKGKNFQLPVYMALAKTWLEANTSSPTVAGGGTSSPAATGRGSTMTGSALFYRLEENDAVEAPLEIGPAFWKEHGDRFYENLAFLVKNIESGSYYIRPSDSRGYCSWCDYSSICRKEHKPTQTRSENSTIREKHEAAFTPIKK